MSAFLFLFAAAWAALALAVLPHAIGLVLIVQTLFYGFFPPIAMVWLGIKVSHATTAKYQKLRETAGLVPGLGWEHREGQTWLALNPNTRTMTVVNGSLVKTYAYAEIRAWEAVSQAAERFVGATFQGGLAAGGANARANAAAAAQSGFFITVRDVDHPIWRIAMIAPITQAKWMEIFRQEINEGGVGAEAQAPPAVRSVNP